MKDLTDSEWKQARSGLCIGSFIGVVVTLLSPGWGIIVGIGIFMLLTPLFD
ncbi:hypothetical protein KAR91_33635 [Candidatus Pacearchaeota archaeon]|nr:hypothetical protein [Candidatus Pacearchaeota archaeon]